MADERKEQLLSPDLVARQGFANAMRGYDKEEVRAFLARVSEQIGRLLEREHDLLTRLRDAEDRAAHPELDESTLAGALGEETARLLRSAQEASAAIRAKAEDQALRAGEDAHQFATNLRQQAETLLNEKTTEAERIAQTLHATASEEAERIGARARAEAESILAEAKRQGQALIEEAEHGRERVMGDLHRRRLVAATQVEQLRAGRERLLDAYRTVRRTLEEVTDDLQRADAEARAAAEAAGRRPPPDVPAEEVVAEADQPAALAAAVEEEAEVAEQPAAPAAVDVSPDESAPAVPAVEGVFAKIRAQRAEEVEVAEAPPDPPDSAEAEAAPAETAPPTPEAEAPVSDADEARLQQREAALQPLEANLARRLKRALQDEQNEILDRLRGQRGRPAAAAVLPTPEGHGERYLSVSRELLEEAAAAGASAVPKDLAAEKPDTAELAEVAADLAATIVEPLRRRLERAFDGTEEDATVIADRVSAAYRELKTQRIEQVAADHIVAAHNRGLYGALAEGAGVRWLVYDTGGPCPDCDDNVLAGTIKRGEAFPTGQLVPPAHGGCQCLLVPERA